MGWSVISEISRTKTPWVTIITEHVQDENNTDLTYWRVQKADSLIVLPVHEDRLLLPERLFYRHGAGDETYDFPGGRILQSESHTEAASRLLTKEMDIEKKDIFQITPLTSSGLLINSAFSNQRLHGVIATVSVRPPGTMSYRASIEEFSELLERLTCLQCRALALEWWFRQNQRQ